MTTFIARIAGREVHGRLSPSEPRLVLATNPAGKGVLDGGWWPRSWDPEAELPGLIIALHERYGSIRNVVLNGAVWHGRLRRLTVGGHVLGWVWFVTLGPALMVATTDEGDQLELLVVPASASAMVAHHAMAAAPIRQHSPRPGSSRHRFGAVVVVPPRSGQGRLATVSRTAEFSNASRLWRASGTMSRSPVRASQDTSPANIRTRP